MSKIVFFELAWEQYEDGCIKIYQCKNHYEDK